VTQIARNGVPEFMVRRQAGFMPESKTLDCYIRLGEMFTHNSAAQLVL
jgi:hypothetical protein